MGNLLIAIPGVNGSGTAARWFGRGLEAFRRIHGTGPARTLELPFAHVATFSRLETEAGGRLARDPRTGSCLAASGTWFHSLGYASGQEEALLGRYLDVGAQRVASELEGFFIIVVADARSRETLVLTDLVGSCHGFVRRCEDAVVVSTSSIVLAALADVELDPVACQEFLDMGIIYEDRTLYRQVRKLGPASVFRFVPGAAMCRDVYWRVTDLEAESLEGPEAACRVWDGLVRGAQKIERLFARPVCDLTGGYDSRAVVAAFVGAGLHCATVVTGPATSPDVRVSRALAAMAGLPHRHLGRETQVAGERLDDVLRFTDGEYDACDYIPTLTVHRRLAEEFEISVNGSFGELARGYWWELLAPATGARRPLDAMKVSAARYAAKKFDSTLFPSEIRLDLVRHMAEVIDRTVAGLERLPNTLQLDYTYLVLRMQRWQGRIASSTNRLWPCVSPFLLRSVLEPVLATKARWRRRSLLVRYMLARFQPAWADFPLEHGYPAAPATWRNLHHFAPLVAYYGQRFLDRARRYGRLGRRPVPGGGLLPPPEALVALPEIREILDTRTMHLAGLLDRGRLDTFLSLARRSGFPYAQQWSRVLTLEHTVRLLAEVRGAKVG